MTQSQTRFLRLSLPDPDHPGKYFNALTDPNPDHFSLIADEDNVLIKELLAEANTIAQPGGSGYTMLTVPHNLGYIPLAFPYALIPTVIGFSSINLWTLITNQFNPIQPPFAMVAVDTQNFYFVNFAGFPNLSVFYRIFYDDMSNNGSPEMTESKSGIKFVRPGKSATSKNPNDYIMHTDLNNLKILHQEVKAISLSSGMNTIAHNANIDDPVQCIAFVKFPDGKTAFVSALARTYSYDESKWLSVSADKDNIYIDSSGSFSIDISYFFFGKGKDGTVPGGKTYLAWTKGGKDVFKSKNPDDFNFHHKYPTLKYFYSDSYNMGTVNNTTTAVLNHGLGYVPFFAAYVSDLLQFDIFNGNSEPVYALTPYFLGRSTLGSPNQNVAAFVYVDEDNLYFKAYFQTNAIGTSFPFNKFLFKIFLNDLGL